ncbi:hypothetical protein BBJ28_00023154 [Nothophytophthora sp. Chile5]|nr:hypothetical protein BBJ28_00023154 [Nothophytophthora sp. Chile5]
MANDEQEVDPSPENSEDAERIEEEKEEEEDESDEEGLDGEAILARRKKNAAKRLSAVRLADAIAELPRD